MHHTNEGLQSLISYGSAGAASGAVLTVSKDSLEVLDTLANTAEQLTLILACLVVLVRLIYDTTRLIKYFLKGKSGNE